MSSAPDARQEVASRGQSDPSTQTARDAHPQHEDVEGNPIRVLAILNALLRGRWIVVGVASGVTTLAIVYVLLATPVFTATAKFLPSQSPAVSARMGAIIEGAANVGRSDDPSTDYYVALVQSPSFLRSVTAREFTDTDGAVKPLLAMFGPADSSGLDGERRAAERLGKMVSISAARAVGNLPRMITLECRATRPTLAADVCSAILDEIKRHNNEIRGDKAKQNREFIQTQLEGAKQELDAATEAFATFTARNRKIVSPALEADRDRLERLVRVKEDVYNTLSRQLVLARIEEQETRPSIEMIQSPEPPLSRSAPARSRTVMLAGIIGLLLGCGSAYLWDRARKLNPSDPEAEELRSNLAGIRREIFPFFRAVSRHH